MSTKTHPFNVVYGGQGPWERDPKIEQMLAHEPSARPARGQQMPGRNGPCFCGSGKKFKNAVGYGWLHEYESILGKGIWPEQ